MKTLSECIALLFVSRGTFRDEKLAKVYRVHETRQSNLAQMHVIDALPNGVCFFYPIDPKKYSTLKNLQLSKFHRSTRLDFA